MNKNQKKHLEYIKKQFNENIKSSVKFYGYKAISKFIIYKKNDLFFSYSIYILSLKDGNICIKVENYLKPYIYDNLFWEIFDMKSNIAYRDSLRAIGAFKMPSIKISGKYFMNCNFENIEKSSNDIAEYIDNENTMYIKNLENNVTKFDEMILNQNEFESEKLTRMIANISIGKIEEAKKLAELELKIGESGNFIDGRNGKNIYNYIVIYCDNNKNKSN